MLSLKLDTSHEDILYFSTNGPGNKFNIFHIRALEEYLILRGGAVKSLARTTSRCRRTESIVSLERGDCSCAELQVFSCYTG